MSLATESAAARFAGIEDWTGADLVDAMVEGQFIAIAALHAARQPIAKAIAAAVPRLQAGGRLIYLGAGTSGRIATQDAAELPPTFNWPYARAISIMAGGEGAFLEAVEGAEDNQEAAIAELDAHNTGPNDVVIGLAASGRTPFVIAGLEHARSIGALTIGIQNNPGGQVGAVSEIGIVLDTGPELLAGSTRMKAGTAQKAALNCLSTGIMVGLGYVYKGLMVDMRPTNEKLRIRAAHIVSAITGVDVDTATAVLGQNDYAIKLACVILLKNMDRQQALDHLEDAGGNLRVALDGTA